MAPNIAVMGHHLVRSIIAWSVCKSPPNIWFHCILYTYTKLIVHRCPLHWDVPRFYIAHNPPPPPPPQQRFNCSEVSTDNWISLHRDQGHYTTSKTITTLHQLHIYFKHNHLSITIMNLRQIQLPMHWIHLYHTLFTIKIIIIHIPHNFSTS